VSVKEPFMIFYGSKIQASILTGVFFSEKTANLPNWGSKVKVISV
jgi:hypothetical protein